MKEVKYLKIDELKGGYLYKIIARNATFGIWIPQRYSFVISRTKFRDNYIFEEFHWDCPAFATVKPLEEIEKSPFDFEKIDIVEYYKEKEMLEYLNKFEDEYNKKFEESLKHS